MKGTEEKINVKIEKVAGHFTVFGMWFSGLMSYVMYQNLFWAIIHAIFGWVSVIYWAINLNPLFFTRVREIIALVAGGQ